MIELFIACLAIVGAVAAGYNVMWGVRSFSEPAETARHAEEQNNALAIMIVCGIVGLILTAVLL